MEQKGQRDSVTLVAEVLALLDVLDDAEKVAVCGELHRQLAQKEEATTMVVVQATAVRKGVQMATAEFVVVKSEQPREVAAGVVELAQAATPALWVEIRAALAVAARETDFGPAAAG